MIVAVKTTLDAILSDAAPLAVAVSGGVDSLTLASAARRRLGDRMRAVHATSPAVPAEATARVQALAEAEGWDLRIVDAGEFADPRYRANPVNRCFFCKTNLYAAIGGTVGAGVTIVSGTNKDDLGEYRPGLDAAREHGVCHPYVKAGMDKAAVRRLARDLGLADLAELPAAPCLSSRVETGLPIEAETLDFIHAVERLIGDRLGEHRPGRAVRCRVRAIGTVIELDPASLVALGEADRAAVQEAVLGMAPVGLGRRLAFAPYRTGSAFLTGSTR